MMEVLDALTESLLASIQHYSVIISSTVLMPVMRSHVVGFVMNVRDHLGLILVTSTNSRNKIVITVE